MENLEQLKKWLSELLYRDNNLENYFQIKTSSQRFEGGSEEFTHVVYFYTKYNRLYLVVAPSSSRDGTIYFGCQISDRKPRAGEDWTRGNDLADGKFNQETWNRIKNDIISYELVKVAKKERVIEDTLPGPNISSPPHEELLDWLLKQALPNYEWALEQHKKGNDKHLVIFMEGLVNVLKKEKSPKDSAVNKDQLIYELFRIIDDIDTAGDMFKENTEGYRKYVVKRQEQRWEHIKEDFVNKLYNVFHPKDEDKSDV